MSEQEIAVGRIDELDNPGCREFTIGEGDWPFRGFVVRKGDDVYAYQNFCVHAGHPLNWSPNRFLTNGGDALICASHGATYEIETGFCFAGPGNGRSLKKLPVELRDGVIYVSGPTSL